MTTEELTEWFYEIFWPKYKHFLKVPDKNTAYGPGSRGGALKKILTMKPSKKLREKIIFELDAQTRHRRLLCDKLGLSEYKKQTAPLAKNGNGEVYKNYQSTTWLNRMGWLNEIPTITEDNARQGKKCWCGKETHGPNFDVCTVHLVNKQFSAVK